MKRLDQLVIKELIGPWAFGVALFGALLFAATYLGRVAEYISKGLSGDLVGQATMLILPGILVQTFAMSMLLASLLAFGRLSSDSEIVAIRAAGVSLFRVIAPVSGFALCVAAVAFLANETIVPASAKRLLMLADQITRQLDGSSEKGTSYPITEKGVLKGMVVAKSFIVSEGVLLGALITSYDKDGFPSAYVYADRLEFDPNKFKSGGGWRIRGKATLTRADGSQVLTLDEGAWPPDVPEVTFSVEDLLKKGQKTFEPFSMRELREIIQKEDAATTKTMTAKELRNFQYGYWNKIALPLAAFIFGTLGAALGVRNHRTGTAAGFALAIAIIFGYFTIANFMNVWALGGSFPPFVASFTPIVIGLVASVIIIWRRNA